MTLRTSYTLIAPFYDLLIRRFSQKLRINSLQRLGDVNGLSILLPGIGTGLDIPHLPAGAHYTGMDLTPAMLKRAQLQIPEGLNMALQTGDAMALPFENNQFDCVIMHLILAVVPEPQKALAEAARVVKPGGRILILDKFLKPNETAWLKRAISPIMGRIATRTDVVFEKLFSSLPELTLNYNEAAGLGGWFRHIELNKD
ncbi:MAG: methyltransferase domain-containing protein [Gammaproteobacteria bacterium]|nr:methyltransferase domain-containing protein [Gammaproteobacteria bacterium]